MKKILFLLLFFYFSNSVFAGLDFYLSNQSLPYANDVWTSQNFPEVGASKIQVDRYFHREEFPASYRKTPQEIQDAIDDVFSHLSLPERQARYTSFMAFEKHDLSQYITLALSPNTEADISYKANAWFVLTPFETTFQSCGIALNQRKTIVRTLLERIYNNDFPRLEDMQYSDIRFGDCIIPFPDMRRGGTSIANSFPSNKIAAQALSWNPLRFWTLEDSVDLISLTNVTLEGSYTWVQANNLLDLHSTRIEQKTNFNKENGESKLLFVHQNHTINPFQESLMQGNNTLWYTIAGVVFNTTHPLFINSSDTEENRTFSKWKEIYPGVYSKTLIQEDSFTKVGSVFVPKQTVGVTTYYAVIYNYDTSSPQCETTLYSHESLWNENFIFPAYPWFQTSKYGYFVCSEDESSCLCDSSTPGCFTRDTKVLSIPQEILHSGAFQYTFSNVAGLTKMCQSPNNQKIFYDKTSPDVKITLPGYPEASLIREYVSNNGVLYDGQQISEKRMYHISNPLTFQASATLSMKLELYDPYDSMKVQEGVSGLSSYTLSISELQNANWVEKIHDTQTFSPYNSGGTITTSDRYMLDVSTLPGIDTIVTKIGKYQVYLNSFDAAGNEARVIFYFDIIPGNIDTTKSILQATAQNTLYADNTASYLYTLTLKDSYLNPIVGRKVSSISHTCSSAPGCSELRLDMTWANPSGNIALEIPSFDPISDTEWKIHFTARSLAPGVFTESFLVSFTDPVTSARFIGTSNTFLKPLQGILEVKVWTQWLSDRLPLDQESRFRVRIKDPWAYWYSWTLWDFSSSLHARHPDTNFVLSGSLQTQIDGVYFSGTFESHLSAEEKHKTLLEIGSSSLSSVIVSYTIAGKIVKYYLSFDAISQNPLTLSDTRGLQNPVDIKGNLQWVGNTHNLTERQNNTDMNTADLRNLLRKNVEKNIKTRENNTVIAGVKYIDKTNDLNKLYILESNPNFETLVVRNGNIHIKNNFNDAWKVIGLISYIDTGYNTQNDYNKVGNIYIEPDVGSIKAYIYADGWIISTNLGVPISWDIATRTTLLQNQLYFFGSLFTRNTLAGGNILSGEYMLPGGQKTLNQSLSTIYDLYYTRRGNTNCEMDAYGFCNKPEYVIIEYDSRVSSTPPKLFAQ